MGSKKKIWEASGIGGKERKYHPGTAMEKDNPEKCAELNEAFLSGIVFNMAKKNPRGKSRAMSKMTHIIIPEKQFSVNALIALCFASQKQRKFYE